MSALVPRRQRTKRTAHAIQAVALDPRGSRKGSAMTSRPARHAAPTRKRAPSMPSSSRGEQADDLVRREEVPGRARPDRGEAGIGGEAQRPVDEDRECHEQDQHACPRGCLAHQEVGVERHRLLLGLDLLGHERRLARDEEQVRGHEERDQRRQRRHVEAEGVPERAAAHLVAAAHEPAQRRRR